jgi:hypothetical protein
MWQALAQLARVQRARGNTEQANANLSRARILVESIAARTPENLRAQFLENASKAL